MKFGMVLTGKIRGVNVSTRILVEKRGIIKCLPKYIPQYSVGDEWFDIDTIGFFSQCEAEACIDNYLEGKDPRYPYYISYPEGQPA